jgi:hypothetical protein
MTPGTVHASKLPLGSGGNNPSRAYEMRTPTGDSRYGPRDQSDNPRECAQPYGAGVDVTRDELLSINIDMTDPGLPWWACTAVEST